MQKVPTRLALAAVAATTLAVTTLAAPASALQNDASTAVNAQLIPSDPAFAAASYAGPVQVAGATTVWMVLSAQAAAVRSQLADLRS